MKILCKLYVVNNDINVFMGDSNLLISLAGPGYTKLVYIHGYDIRKKFHSIKSR